MGTQLLKVNTITLRQWSNFTGLDKLHMCICDILAIVNFTNCTTSLFFNKYAHKHTFSVSWKCEMTWHVFLFMFNALHLTISNLIKVSKINLQRSCFPVFPTLPWQQLKLERPSTEKMKFNHHCEIFGMLLFFEILKTYDLFLRLQLDSSSEPLSS